MSREIDERVVAMYFNNDQFEKGAKQSLKTIEELKKGLDFENVGESFEKVSKITEKGFGLKDSTKELGNFGKAMNSVGKVAKSAFGMATNVITSPVRALMSGLKTLEGYTGKVLGFNLASKLVNTGETVVRAFTIDPMRTGWQEYELKMDSIKTIMTGTMDEFKRVMGGDYTEEAHLAAVKKSLEELNKYADDTIYSFQDMTSNIGKFTNNGVALEDAVSAMKGIANAAADAGQGTNEASRAMYNLSQAIGMGKLTMIDWKSIENANMGTIKLKNVLIEMGVAMGTLEKKGDKYYTKTKKHMEVTAENFRETLSEEWVNNDVLLSGLKVFSGDLSAVELANLGIPKEIAEEMERIGLEAKEAATQVRTFSKMWDALKEAAQSGWATTWETIFGDVNEATEFYTDLNKRFSAMLDGAAKSRNELLKAWRGQGVDPHDIDVFTDLVKNLSSIDWDKYQYTNWYKKGEGVRDVTEEIAKQLLEGKDYAEIQSYLNTTWNIDANDALKAIQLVADKLETLDYLGKDGRSVLIEGINSLLDAFGNIGKVFSDVKKSLFGEATANGLQALTQKFADAMASFRDWTATLNGNSTIETLKVGLQGVLSVVKMLWNSAKRLASLAMQVLEPIGKFFTDIFGGVGEWLTSISGGSLWDGIKKIGDSLKGLTKIKIGDWFKNAAKSVGNLFSNLTGKVAGWFSDNGFEGIGNFLTKAQTSVSTAWNKMLAWEGWSAIGEFLGNTFNWIKDKAATVVGWFTSSSDGEPSKAGQFLSDVVSNIAVIWTRITTWPVWAQIGEFLGNTFNWIKDKAVTVVGWFTSSDGEPSKAGQFLSDVVSEISRVWNTDILGNSIWEDIGSFLSDVAGWILGLFSSKKNENVDADEIVPEISESDADEAEQRVSLFERIATSLGDLATKAVGWNGWKDVSDFFASIFNGLSGVIASLNQSNSLDRIWDIISSALNIIITILEDITKFAEKIVVDKDALTIIGSIVAIIGTIIGKIVLSKLMSNVWMFQSFGKQFLEIAGGIALIAVAIGILGNLDDDVLLKGGAAVLALGVVVGVITSLITKLKDAGPEPIQTKAWERLGSNLIKWIGIAGTIAVTLALLPNLISAIGETNLNGKDVFEILGGLTVLIAGISAITGIIAAFKIDAGTMISAALGFAVSVPIVISGIAAGLLAFGGLLTLVDDMGEGDTLAKMGEGLGKLINAFKIAFSGKEASPDELGETADGLKELSEKAKDIDEEGLKKLESVMGIFQRIGNMKIRDATVLGQLFKGTLTFSELPDAVDSIGGAMVKLGLYGLQLNEIPDAENAIARANDIVDLLGRLAELASYADFLNSFRQFKSGSEFLEFIDKISDPKKYNAEGLTKTVETFSGIAENINTAILEAVPNIDTEPLINAVYDSLVSDEAKYKLVSAFEQLGKSMPEEGVTLSGENVNFDFSSLLSLFSGKGGLGGILGGLLGGEGGIGGMLSGLLGENGQVTSMINKIIGTEEEPGFFGNVKTWLEEFSSNPEYKMGNILGLTTADGEADMQAYITALETKLAEFQNGGGLDSKISMVLDESSMPAWFNGTAALEITGTVNLDPVSLGAITVGISTLRDTTINNTNRIVDTLYNLNSRIDGLNDSIRSMRLVLDTGAIAGAVDSALGKRFAVTSRTGATSGTNAQGGR